MAYRNVLKTGLFKTFRFKTWPIKTDGYRAWAALGLQMDTGSAGRARRRRGGGGGGGSGAHLTAADGAL